MQCATALRAVPEYCHHTKWRGMSRVPTNQLGPDSPWLLVGIGWVWFSLLAALALFVDLSAALSTVVRTRDADGDASRSIGSWIALLSPICVMCAFVGHVTLERRFRAAHHPEDGPRCECGYLLIGLPSRRCPECGRSGAAYDWFDRDVNAAVLLELARYATASAFAVSVGYCATVYSGPGPRTFMVLCGGAAWLAAHWALVHLHRGVSAHAAR